SNLFENLGERDKAAWRMVHFGTTHDDTRALTIDAMNAKMKAAFPNVEFREAWTSRIILRKLKARGIERLNPAEALVRLHEEGYTHILVQSTNIIEGTEMKELRREVESLSLNFKDIRMGAPLLYTPEDYETVADALTKAMDKAFPAGQKLLVGHGTPDPATASYAMFDYLLKAAGHPFYHVGTVEGYPSYDDALRLLKAAKVRTVTLAPLMFVAGDHAKNDIAGDWKEQLEKQGFKVNLYLKGLGENPAVQDLFISHARFAAHHKTVDMSAKKRGYSQK
nr:sirohydrochlorin cobaltochelatase [Odoribacter sp.]